MDQRDDWHLTDDIPHEQGRGDPFAAAIRASRMPMIITDPRQPDNPIVFANEAFQRLTGYSRDEIIGTNCRFLQGPDTDRAEVAKVRDAIANDTDVNVDLLNYKKDGTTFWNALYVSPVRNEAGAVEFFFASQLDVTERIEAQRVIAEQKGIVEREVSTRTAELEQALEAKTLLLNEVDHRVKNNLNMIGSLLRLQARRLPDPELRHTLDAMLERVDALASVHRRLYQSGDVMRFDIGAFAQGLVSDVVGASGRDNIRIESDVEPVLIPSSDAAALGLVLNEVMTNAIKHAFADGRGGTLGLAVSKDGDRATIRVTDDGPGMNGDASGDTLGRTLVERLSRQVGAQTRWDGAEPGTRVTIEFQTDGEGIAT